MSECSEKFCDIFIIIIQNYYMAHVSHVPHHTKSILGLEKLKKNNIPDTLKEKKKKKKITKRKSINQYWQSDFYDKLLAVSSIRCNL